MSHILGFFWKESVQLSFKPSLSQSALDPFLPRTLWRRRIKRRRAESQPVAPAGAGKLGLCRCGRQGRGGRWCGTSHSCLRQRIPGQWWVFQAPAGTRSGVYLRTSPGTSCSLSQRPDGGQRWALRTLWNCPYSADPWRLPGSDSKNGKQRRWVTAALLRLGTWPIWL